MNSFKNVFPSKRLMNKILFQMDSPWSSRKLLPLFQELYKTHNLEPTKLSTNPQVLFNMNRFLEQVKNRTHQQHVTLKEMQNWLLRQAAHLGDNNATSLLCYHILIDEKAVDEQENAQSLLNKLLQVNHPLAFKIVGDLSNFSGRYDLAKKWYEKYLKVVAPSTPQECNWKFEALEKLGEIQVRDGNIQEAESNFLQVIRNSLLVESVKSYFLLSQIYGKFEPLKSKLLLEQCCTQGFREAFKEVGFLELQYFNNIEKAKIWFKLGMELRDLTCFFGFLECCVKTSNWDEAYNCLQVLEKLAKSSETNMQFFKTLENDYKSTIETTKMQKEKKDQKLNKDTEE